MQSNAPLLPSNFLFFPTGHQSGRRFPTEFYEIVFQKWLVSLLCPAKARRRSGQAYRDAEEPRKRAIQRKMVHTQHFGYHFVNHVGPIRSRQDDDVFQRLNSIHFGKNLRKDAIAHAATVTTESGAADFLTNTALVTFLCE